MRLNKIAIKDKEVFEKYLKPHNHELSVYNFANIYIWKEFFDIRWQIADDNLCVFFRDNIGCFLYLPPLGETKSLKAVEAAFEIMDKLNSNREVSRIENAEEKKIDFYKEAGYICKVKSHDYICLRDGLADLKGDRFKSKRACVNYFTRHYEFAYLKFSLEDKDDCLKLYDCWMKNRKVKNHDPIYQQMFEDSRGSLKVLLEDFNRLKVAGRVVKINEEIKAFTFGFEINRTMFCVLYEVADLSMKGLSQFIFKEFCRELDGYAYINVMDDSGLENLKKVKLSYRPQRLAPAYIIKKEIL